jgi:DNA-binding NarL/FixJ family response regulator
MRGPQSDKQKRDAGAGVVVAMQLVVTNQPGSIQARQTAPGHRPMWAVICVCGPIPTVEVLDPCEVGGAEPRMPNETLIALASDTDGRRIAPRPLLMPVGRGENLAVAQQGGSGQAHSPIPLGRTSELGEVERFLAADRPERALVLCGEPGIGKSTVWGAGVELARSRGFATLCTRASESEAQLSFAGLADLIEATGPGVLASLPAPQRHALEVALRRAEPAGPPPEPLAIAAGLLATLRLMSGRGPVLVAVDDLPWLDGASADALVFAARRVAGEDVRFLVARRSGPRSPLEVVLETARVVRLELGPLSFGAVSRLLVDRLERSLPRRVVRQLFDTSGGNPLFAVELGRAVLERGVPEIGARLPMPAMPSELFGVRVEALHPDMRRALLAVALSGGLTREELAAVADPLAIEDAEAIGVLIADGTRVRAVHPLLAAAASGRSSARERRELHRLLSEAVSDAVLRARHRALAASAPDARLAGELSAAAAQAAARAAVQDAAELAGHALRLTDASDSRYDGRLLALARYLIEAGEQPRATELLTGRIGTLRAGPARAAAHLLLGEVADIAAEAEHLTLASADSATDPGLRAQALARRAINQVIQRVARITDAEQMAGEALATAGSAGPDDERQALVALAWARIMRGRSIDDLLERSTAVSPLASSLYDRSVERPAGVRFAFRGESASAREVFRGLLASADERGEVRSAMVCLAQLCEVELRAGHADAAVRVLDELDQWTALEPMASGFRARVDASLAALHGEPERATTLAETVLQASESATPEWDRLEARRAAGLAALLQREPKRAVSSLYAVWEHTEREGVEDPGAFPVAGDLVEALTEAGRFEAARAVIRRLSDLATAQEHPWGLATVTRSTAVVTLAAGHDGAAADDLARAVAAYRALGLDFDAARTLLVLGRAQRRHKKRAAARQTLGQSRSAFEQLGCPGWVRAAAAELDRISGRRTATAGSLTPGEQRVAELAASGLSNKEIAAQLYLSVSTVETHLSQVYAKLGVRSRAQLTRHLGTPV